MEIHSFDMISCDVINVHVYPGILNTHYTTGQGPVQASLKCNFQVSSTDFFFPNFFFFKLQYEIKQWLFICEGNHCHSFIFPIVRHVNYILSDDDTRWFCGQCRSRSECIECAVWSLIYNVHIFILDYNLIISLSCIGNVFLANEIDWLIDRLIEWCFTPFSIVF